MCIIYVIRCRKFGYVAWAFLHMQIDPSFVAKQRCMLSGCIKDKVQFHGRQRAHLHHPQSACTRWWCGTPYDAVWQSKSHRSPMSTGSIVHIANYKSEQRKYPKYWSEQERTKLSRNKNITNLYAINKYTTTNTCVSTRAALVGLCIFCRACLLWLLLCCYTHPTCCRPRRVNLASGGGCLPPKKCWLTAPTKGWGGVFLHQKCSGHSSQGWKGGRGFPSPPPTHGRDRRILLSCHSCGCGGSSLL